MIRIPHGRDVTLLTVRLLLGTILFAHGWQKLVVKGIGQTTDGFEHLSIPVAIVSASFVTVVEFVGGVLLLVGLLCSTVAVLEGLVMIGAAVFVHGRHGVFVTDGGWELVGAIFAALAGLAAAGPGRFSVAHLVARHRARQPQQADLVPELPPVGFPPLPGSDDPFAEPAPAAGLPYVPVVRFARTPGS